MTQTQLEVFRDLIQRSETTPELHLFKTVSGYIKWTVNQVPRNPQLMITVTRDDHPTPSIFTTLVPGEDRLQIEQLLNLAKNRAEADILEAGKLNDTKELLGRLIEDIDLVLREREGNNFKDVELQAQDGKLVKVRFGSYLRSFRPYVTIQQHNGVLVVKLISAFEGYVLDVVLPDDYATMDKATLKAYLVERLTKAQADW